MGGGQNAPLTSPKCPLCPHPCASLSPGGRWLVLPHPGPAGYPCLSFPVRHRAYHTSLPWGCGTQRMEGEKGPWWLPLGDQDVATSPRGHGMKLEAPGIYTRASRLPPHPDGETSQAELPKVPFCPHICHVTISRPWVCVGSRSSHPTSLGSRGGGGGEGPQQAGGLTSIHLSCVW